MNPAAARKQTILLEYLRDEDAKQYEESNPFLFEQDRIRQVVIGNCRLIDVKLEKNGAYEFVPKVSSVREISFFDSLLTYAFTFMTELRSILRV